MFEVGSLLDGSDQRSRLTAERVAKGSGDARDDGVPLAQGAQEPIDVTVLGVSRIVANPHFHTGRADLIQQFDQREMGLQEIRLAAKLRIAGVLGLAESTTGG
jgi:hypothetical protein